MAIKGFYESSLTTSEIFNDENNGINNIGSKNSVLQKSIELIKNTKHLTNEDIEASYIAVRQITDSLTREAMKAFDDERIVLLYNEVPSTRMTQALPFITLKTSKGFVTYVFVDKYISISREGVMSMQAPVLRDLLTSALIANSLKNNYERLASSQYLQKILMEVYTKMVIRIINKEFSVISDKIVADTLQYWINRFFLTNILGAHDTPENIETISSKHFKFIDELKYSEIKNQYESANPQKISELLEVLKLASPRMKTLNLGTFLSNWISYFYVPSMLAVDNIEYLIFMMIALLSGNSIISIAASDIVKETKNIKSFREELLKLI